MRLKLFTHFLMSNKANRVYRLLNDKRGTHIDRQGHEILF